MSVEKFMDLSTCFISKKDEALLKNRDFPRVIYNYEQGHFIHCGNLDINAGSLDIQALQAYGMSEEFITLIKFARKKKCWFLRLDADGDDSYDFPKFVW